MLTEASLVPPSASDSLTPQLDFTVQEISRLAGDAAHWKSNRTHARRLMEEYALAEPLVVDAFWQAYHETKDRQFMVKKPMPYIFKLTRQSLEGKKTKRRRDLAGKYAHLVRS